MLRKSSGRNAQYSLLAVLHGDLTYRLVVYHLPFGREIRNSKEFSEPVYWWYVSPILLALARFRGVFEHE